MAGLAATAQAQTAPPFPHVAVTRIEPIKQYSDIYGRDGDYSIGINVKSYWNFRATFLSNDNASGTNSIHNSLSATSSLSNATSGIDLSQADENYLDSSGGPKRIVPLTSAENAFDRNHKIIAPASGTCNAEYLYGSFDET